MYVYKSAEAFSRYFIPIILLFLLSPSAVTGQVLRGKITNQAGEPIPYATVYIQELRQGTT
jgi:hypothetical protein